MAFQAYSILRRVVNNVPVRLKRSTIPIVSGELLEGSPSMFTLNVFVLANLVSIAVAFLISLGLNGETIQVNEIITGAPLLYQSSLMNDTIPRKPLRARPIVATCKQIKDNSVNYYPLAFNVSFGAILHDLTKFRTKNKSLRYINASSSQCQWEAEPVLSITNCSRCSSYMRDDSVKSYVTLYNLTESRLLAGTGRVSNWYSTVKYYFGMNLDPDRVRTVKTSSTKDLLPRDRLTCVTIRSGTLKPTRTNGRWHCIVIRDDNVSRQRVLAYGVMYPIHTTGRRSVRTYEFQRRSSFGIVSNIFQIKLKSEIFTSTLREIDTYIPYSLVQIVDRLVSHNVMAKPISHATEQKDLDVTVIAPMTWSLLIAFVVVAALIGPCHEILSCWSTRQYGTDFTALMNVNQYDALSTWLPDDLSPNAVQNNSTSTYSRFNYRNRNDTLHAASNLQEYDVNDTVQFHW